MSAFFGGLAKSIVRGGAVKALVKKAVKGLKGGIGKIIKGAKSSSVKTTRGLKSGAAQAAALPEAVSGGFGFVKTLPKGFGTGNTLQVFKNVVARDLAKASRTALSQDSAQRLAAKFAKVMTNKNQGKVLRQILKNARANETWGQYLKRMGRKGGVLTQELIQGGAENVAIDQTGQILLKGVAAAGTVGTTAATTALVVKKNNKK